MYWVNITCAAWLYTHRQLKTTHAHVHMGSPHLFIIYNSVVLDLVINHCMINEILCDSPWLQGSSSCLPAYACMCIHVYITEKQFQVWNPLLSTSSTYVCRYAKEGIQEFSKVVSIIHSWRDLGVYFTAFEY